MPSFLFLNLSSSSRAASKCALLAKNGSTSRNFFRSFYFYFFNTLSIRSCFFFLMSLVLPMIWSMWKRGTFFQVWQDRLSESRIFSSSPNLLSFFYVRLSTLFNSSGVIRVSSIIIPLCFLPSLLSNLFFSFFYATERKILSVIHCIFSSSCFYAILGSLGSSSSTSSSIFVVSLLLPCWSPSRLSYSWDKLFYFGEATLCNSPSLPICWASSSLRSPSSSRGSRNSTSLIWTSGQTLTPLSLFRSRIFWSRKPISLAASTGQA